MEGSGDDAMKKLCVAYFSSKNRAVSVHRFAFRDWEGLGEATVNAVMVVVASNNI